MKSSNRALHDALRCRAFKEAVEGRREGEDLGGNSMDWGHFSSLFDMKWPEYRPKTSNFGILCM